MSGKDNPIKGTAKARRVGRQLRAAADAAKRNLTEAEPEKSEAGAVQRTVENTRFARRLAAGAYRRMEYVSKGGLDGLSYGDPEAKPEHDQTTGAYGRRTRQANPGMEMQRRKASADTQKAVKAAAAGRQAKQAGTAVQRGLESVGKSFAARFKRMLPFSFFAVVIALVIMVVMGALLSLLSPLSFFFSDTGAENTYSVCEGYDHQ